MSSGSHVSNSNHDRMMRSCSLSNPLVEEDCLTYGIHHPPPNIHRPLLSIFHMYYPPLVVYRYTHDTICITILGVSDISFYSRLFQGVEKNEKESHIWRSREIAKWQSCTMSPIIYITFSHLADALIQSDLHQVQGHFPEASKVKFRTQRHNVIFARTSNLLITSPIP